jgi:hypothetical protein
MRIVNLPFTRMGSIRVGQKQFVGKDSGARSSSSSTIIEDRDSHEPEISSSISGSGRPSQQEVDRLQSVRSQQAPQQIHQRKGPRGSGASKKKKQYISF